MKPTILCLGLMLGLLVCSSVDADEIAIALQEVAELANKCADQTEVESEREILGQLEVSLHLAAAFKWISTSPHWDTITPELAGLKQVLNTKAESATMRRVQLLYVQLATRIIDTITDGESREVDEQQLGQFQTLQRAVEKEIAMLVGAPVGDVHSTMAIGQTKNVVLEMPSGNWPVQNQGSTRTIMTSRHAVPTANGNAAGDLKVHNLKQRAVKRDHLGEKRSWQVALTNTSEGPVDVYIKVEWVDSDGFQVKYDRGSRVIEPGDHSFGESVWLEGEELTNAKTFRISEVSAKKR